MKVILVPVGSHGDVHPFVGLGVELRRRGHDVTLITNGHFREMVERAGAGVGGIEFVEVGTDEEYRQVIANPELWQSHRAGKYILDFALSRTLRPFYEAVAQRLKPGRTVLAMGSLAFGARLAQEKWDVPGATIHLQPGVFRSVYDTPRFAPFSINWMPRWAKRLLFWLVDRALVDRWFGAHLNPLRAELGLPPVRHILKEYWNSPDRVLGFFPEWFARPQPDWPPQLRLTGFPLYDESDVAPPSPEVEAFFDAGSPPIIFTAGSAMMHGRGFFEACVETCARLGRRGVLLARFAEQIPSPLPPNVRHFEYVPFSAILPRAAAFVHHGGIGSTAQALAAGVPQLVVAMAHDQFDNGERLRRLGAGLWLTSKKYTADSATAMLGRLLDESGFRAAAQQASRRVERGAGIARACDHLEALLPGATRQIAAA